MDERQKQLIDRIAQIVAFSYFGLIAILVFLKATDTIDWPWTWVLAPFWGPVLVMVVGYILFVLIVSLNKGKQ